MSMAVNLSDFDDQWFGVNLQTEGHTLTPPSSQNGPGETEASDCAPPFHHPSLW